MQRLQTTTREASLMLNRMCILSQMHDVYAWFGSSVFFKYSEKNNVSENNEVLNTSMRLAPINIVV